MTTAKIAKSLFPGSIPWYSTKMLHWSLIVSLMGLLIAALGAYCGWFLFPNMVDKKVEEVSMNSIKYALSIIIEVTKDMFAGVPHTIFAFKKFLFPHIEVSILRYRWHNYLKNHIHCMK